VLDISVFGLLMITTEKLKTDFWDCLRHLGKRPQKRGVVALSKNQDFEKSDMLLVLFSY
jgi:hypothetical protein